LIERGDHCPIGDGDEACKNRPEAADGLLPGLAIGGGHPFVQRGEQLGFQRGPGNGEFQQPLALVVRADRLLDQPLRHQVCQHARQRLLGDGEQTQQLEHRQPGAARDEIHRAVMGASEVAVRQNGVCTADHVGIAEIQQLDPAPHFGFAQEQG